MLCAGIAAAGGNCAAWSVVAKTGSSKRMAGVSAVSANLPRYRCCCGCRARRAAPAQVPGVAAVSEFSVVSTVESKLPQHYRNRLDKFDWLREVADRLTLAASQGVNLTRDTA